MRNKIAPNWFPFWIDKWLFGSTRLELPPDERGVFIDFMALAQKDSGFIRANAGVPYRIEQLAGFLCLDRELLEKTIEHCIAVGKLERLDDGTLRLISFEKYIISARHQRRVKADMMSEKADAVSSKADSSEKKRKEKKGNIIKAEKLGLLFKEIWKGWPSEGRFKKKICRIKFSALCKAGKLDDFKKTTRGYFALLEHKEKNEDFLQKPMYLSTWLNNWEEEMSRYVDKDGNPFEYKPRL